MRVGDLFQRLSLGELSNLSIGMDGAGTIEPGKRDQIVMMANSVLVEIYSRFVHRTGFVTLELQPNLKKYRLSPENAVSNTTSGNTAPRYIKDSVQEPFTGGVIRILSVTHQEDPEAAAKEDPLDVRPLSFDGVFVKNPRAGVFLEIEYQARHPELGLPANTTDEISLAPYLEEALQVKVAAAVYAGMNGEGQMAKSMALLSRFEEICQRVKEEGLLQELPQVSIDRFGMGGFV